MNGQATTQWCQIKSLMSVSPCEPNNTHSHACKHHLIRTSLFGGIMYSGSGDIGWGWKVCTVNFSSLCKSAWQQLFSSQLGMIADFIICSLSLWSSSDVFDSFCSAAASFPRCILYIKPSSLKGLLT